MSGCIYVLKGACQTVFEAKEFCIGNDRGRSKMLVCRFMQDYLSDCPIITCWAGCEMLKNDANSNLKRFGGDRI